MTDLQTRLEGTTLVVRIPMRFQHRGGRKRIVAPDGSAIVPTSKPQPDGTLVKALARAWRWRRMLDESVYASVSVIGEAEGISKSYVSRILRLVLLAPDIIEEILAGRADRSLMLERLERPLPASWVQRACIFALPVCVRHADFELVRDAPRPRPFNTPNEIRIAMIVSSARPGPISKIG